jgi:glycosyltransferase involved in cell wall biosynthesis
MKVYINVGPHPQFQELVKYPPKNVNYFYKPVKENHLSLSLRKQRVIISKLQGILPIPRILYLNGKYDLIHSTRGFLVLNRASWIVDLEVASSFTGLNWNGLKNPLTKKIIEKFLSSKYCKKILPQCYAAKQTMFDFLNCKKFEDKIEVVYPAYHVPKFKREKKDGDKIKISFIGLDFIGKGGLDLLKAFMTLEKKYNIELKMKTIIPTKYQKLIKNKKNIIILKENLRRDEFYKFMFFDSDIYVQPTRVDTFGISILEAMSTGLPIITVDIFAQPELVKDGYNGFLIHSDASWYNKIIGKKYCTIFQEHERVSRELSNKLKILIEDSSLRKRMGRNGRKLVEKGKFSIKERNKKLLRIYEEALNQ